MRPVAIPPPMAPRMPMYPPSGPVGQQLFYGQAPPALMPPQVELLVLLMIFGPLLFTLVSFEDIYALAFVGLETFFSYQSLVECKHCLFSM